MDPRSGRKGDHELTVRQLQELLNEDFVRQLDKVFACGTFGDPAASHESLDIFRWFRSINPTLTLGMNTNGGLRDPRYWMELASIFSLPLDYVVFSIDGMAGTNSIYRRGVEWHKVMQNAESYIRAGGHAQWDMLVFEHNQEHVSAARDHARMMGFTHFRTKVSNRFEEHPVAFLAPPKDYQPKVYDGPVVCHAQQEQSLYIAATGDILPCCFWGAEVFRSDQLREWIKNDPEYTELARSLVEKPLPVCQRNCASCAGNTEFAGQWQEETPF